MDVETMVAEIGGGLRDEADPARAEREQRYFQKFPPEERKRLMAL